MKRFLLVYLSALAASHLWVIFFPGAQKLPVGQKRLVLSNRVAMAYVDTAPADRSGRPVVLLLHGSPVGIEMLHPLISALKDEYRVLAPSLPGFEASSRKVPDYSIRAHAAYVSEFLGKLGLTSVHVAGYSMGSGVAIELAHRSPERLASLTLIAGIGAQEHELLGNYYLNHLIHALQLGFIWCLDHGLPHFGLFEDFPLNYYYARNFYDTDQRPLKQYLSEVRAPALILHGDADFFVPPAAAATHHRLLPHATLKILPGEGHLFPWLKPGLAARSLSDFVEKVEAGEAATAGGMTDAERRLQQDALRQIRVEKASGPALWLILLLVALATLASEDLAALSAGMLAANGNISLFEAVLASFCGIFLGDVLLLWSGRLLGRSPFVTRCVNRFVDAQVLHRMESWLREKGSYAIFASRFIPGTRLPLYLAAGYARVSAGKFIAAFGIACALWTPLIVGAGFFLGEAAFRYLAKYDGTIFTLLICVVAFYVFVHKLMLPLMSWRGRRLLYSQYLRVRHWEFWPPYVFYIPVGFYFIYLALRYRSLTLFTAANPAIPDGGVVGESKSAILHGLAGAGKNIARFALIAEGSPGERLSQLAKFMRRQRLRYPVVLKPDAGERGNGVEIILSEAEAVAYLTRQTAAVIAQEYIAGVEFGVFYFRFPEAVRGEIFAITDKRFPSLTGGGVRTLEELILADARAVAMARFHLEKFSGRLREVIPAGEEFRLVELGTHCKGSLFLDGMHLITPALVREIERISRHFEGFYFGRYDIRAPSAGDFCRGRNLKVVELNGVTSEATSIYDPQTPLWRAYRILARQWQIAFEIGRQNAGRGHAPTPLLILLRRLFA